MTEDYTRAPIMRPIERDTQGTIYSRQPTERNRVSVYVPRPTALLGRGDPLGHGSSHAAVTLTDFPWGAE